MRRLATVLMTAAAIFMVALPALAHVTVSVDDPEPGGFAVYTVRVPNETEDASTVGVEVQIPDALAASLYQPHGEWDLRWDGDRLVIDGGEIAPGQFEEFRFQARNPDMETTLSFPAVQTYDDGETVSWTGEPGSDTPASRVSIAAGDGPGTLVVAALGLGAVGTVLGAVSLLRRP